MVVETDTVARFIVMFTAQAENDKSSTIDCFIDCLGCEIIKVVL